MDMQNMKNLISFVFHNAPLQFIKGINFNWPISKNAKPMSLFKGFAIFKPKSRCDYMSQFASFWLKYSVSGLK